jgi:flagellar basal-body rod modification protein FlgD
MSVSSIGGATAAAPGGSTTGSALAQLSSNSETFLRLLTTQLQNQDPMQPQDPTEFTNQLVQFTQVEQQIQSNAKLETLISKLDAFEMNAALSYVGRVIEADGDRTELANGSAQIVYGLESAASQAAIVISDASGKEVRILEGTRTAGRNEVAWDGRDQDGAALPPGVYSFQVLAADSKGKAMTAETRTVGRVQSVEKAGDLGLALMIGGQPVLIGDVLSVRATT